MNKRKLGRRALVCLVVVYVIVHGVHGTPVNTPEDIFRRSFFKLEKKLLIRSETSKQKEFNIPSDIKCTSLDGPTCPSQIGGLGQELSDGLLDRTQHFKGVADIQIKGEHLSDITELLNDEEVINFITKLQDSVEEPAIIEDIMLEEESKEETSKDIKRSAKEKKKEVENLAAETLASLEEHLDDVIENVMANSEFSLSDIEALRQVEDIAINLLDEEDGVTLDELRERAQELVSDPKRAQELMKEASKNLDKLLKSMKEGKITKDQLEKEFNLKSNMPNKKKKKE